MKKRGDTEPGLIPVQAGDGKDELNLVEFPLCALAHRLRPDQKTLRFEDRVWDEQRGVMQTRQLTITGSDAYGLPTALDDEVLVGLVQLTKRHGFIDRRVPFTRYQLIHLLGWRNETKSYERLEASLHRWTGVTLSYRNAWWNKRRGDWMDETFHVLDNVRLCHRGDRPFEDEGAPQSALVWNEVIFRSFQAGHLKSLDFEFFKNLDSAIAKRLYRFLDKRFFHKARWDFDLKEFGWEHAGLARSYDVSGLKRKLQPGIVELEQKRFLRPFPATERFRKVCSGEWRVIFERAAMRPALKEPPSHWSSSDERETLTVALIERGVSAQTARKTVAAYPAGQIQIQLDVFDWMMTRQDPRVSRNPPGFLVSAIQDAYAPPPGFVSRRELAEREQKSAERQHRLETLRWERAARKERREQDRAQAIQSLWQSLSEAEKLEAEAAAVQEAPRLQQELIEWGGTAGSAARRAALDAYLWRCLHPESDRTAASG